MTGRLNRDAAREVDRSSPDGDALLQVLHDYGMFRIGIDDARDRILALLRPAGGVTLTPDEASAAAWALRHLQQKHSYDALRSRDGTRVDLDALAARLEAAL